MAARTPPRRRAAAPCAATRCAADLAFNHHDKLVAEAQHTIQSLLADPLGNHGASWMITGAQTTAVTDVRRDDVEDYKVWLAARPRAGGGTITAETHRQRIRTLRSSSRGSSSGTGRTRRPATR